MLRHNSIRIPMTINGMAYSHTRKEPYGTASVPAGTRETSSIHPGMIPVGPNWPVTTLNRSRNIMEKRSMSPRMS